MEQVEVYMLKNGDDKGNVYSGGYIYSVDEYVAEKFEKEGIAKGIRYQSLKSHKDNVNKAVEEIQEEIARIEGNGRLSADAKFADTQEVIQKYEEKINGIQAQYSHDVQVLQDAAARKASEISMENDFDSDKVRQKAGMLRADVEMATNLLAAAEILQGEASLIDKGTARELLSHFTEIKKTLEEKGKAGHIENRLIRMTVRNVYDDLKKAGEDPSQVAASAEYNMLKTIKEYRNDITGPFKMFKRRRR